MNRFAKIPRIETLAIGDELLTGKISDTNSSYVAKQLFAKGLRLSQTQVVADEPAAIQNAMRAISERARAVICFGGLGPTSDDLTAEVVAELVGTKLVEDPDGRARLEAFLASRSRPVTPQSLKQVVYPEGATRIPNPVGLATGFHVLLRKCRFYFLPGVPAEMRGMMESTVLAHVLAECGHEEKTAQRVWRCIGLPESEMQRLMTPLEKALPDGVWTGYRTRPPENYFYLYATGPTEAAAEAALAGFAIDVEAVLAPYCYSHEEKEIEAEVLSALQQRQVKLVLAESCTGGMVVQRLTQVPGASDWVWGGFVTYQFQAKNQIFGLKLASGGEAVSAETSRSLLKESLRVSGCDLGAAVTGYMGPGGGTASDPVGTVYLAVGDRSGRILEQKWNLVAWERSVLQWATASHVLNAVLAFLKGEKKA